jgi:hypothetical protein
MQYTFLINKTWSSGIYAYYVYSGFINVLFNCFYTSLYEVLGNAMFVIVLYTFLLFVLEVC